MYYEKGRAGVYWFQHDWMKREVVKAEMAWAESRTL